MPDNAVPTRTPNVTPPTPDAPGDITASTDDMLASFYADNTDLKPLTTPAQAATPSNPNTDWDFIKSNLTAQNVDNHVVQQPQQLWPTNQIGPAGTSTKNFFFNTLDAGGNATIPTRVMAPVVTTAPRINTPFTQFKAKYNLPATFGPSDLPNFYNKARTADDTAQLQDYKKVTDYLTNSYGQEPTYKAMGIPQTSTKTPSPSLPVLQSTAAGVSNLQQTLFGSAPQEFQQGWDQLWNAEKQPGATMKDRFYNQMDILSAVTKIGLASIPALAAAQGAAGIVTPILEKIATDVGGPESKFIGTAIAQLGTMAPFGTAALIGLATSKGAGMLAQKIVDGTSLSDSEKKSWVDAATNLGFILGGSAEGIRAGTSEAISGIKDAFNRVTDKWADVDPLFANAKFSAASGMSPVDWNERVMPDALTPREQKIWDAYANQNGRSPEEKDLINKMVSKFAPTAAEYFNQNEEPGKPIDPIFDEKAKTNVKENLGNAINSTFEDMQKESNPNILDALYALGTKNIKNYNDAIEGTGVGKIAPDPSVPFNVVHGVTTQLYNGVIGASADLKAAIAPELDSVDFKGNNQVQSFKRDLVVFAATDPGPDAWSMLKAKYGPLQDAGVDVEGSIKQAQATIADPKFTDTRNKVRPIIEQAGQQFAEQAALSQIHDTSSGIVNDAPLSTPIDPTKYEPNDFVDIEKNKAEGIANELGYRYEGAQKFPGQKALHMFTHPETGGTLSFHPEDLTKEAVQKKMEDSAAKFKAAEETKFEPNAGNVEPISIGSTIKLPSGEEGNVTGIKEEDSGITKKELAGDKLVDVKTKDGISTQYKLSELQDIQPKLGPSSSEPPVPTPPRGTTLPVSLNAVLQPNIKYGDQLADFKGTTAGELFDYLKEKGLTLPSFARLSNKMVPLVRDVPLKIQNIQVNNKSKKGSYTLSEVTGPKGEITVNPNTITTDPNAIYRTIIHESSHAMTLGFMRNGTDRANEFRAKMAALARDVKLSLIKPKDKAGMRFDSSKAPIGFKDQMMAKNPQLKQELYGKSPAEIAAMKLPVGALDYYLNDPEEFVSGVMAGDEDLLKAMNYSPFRQGLSRPGPNYFKKFINDLKEFIGANLDEKGSILDEFGALMDEYYQDIVNYHEENTLPSTQQLSATRMQSYAHLVDDYYDDEQEKLADELDYDQQDDAPESEATVDIKTTQGFVNFIADLKGIDNVTYFKSLQDTTPLGLLRELNDLDQTHDNIVDKYITKLYKEQYTQRFNRSTAEDKVARNLENYQDFKQSLIVRKLCRAQETSPQLYYNYSLTKFPSGATQHAMVQLPDHFKTAKGTQGNTYAESITLQKFISPLEKLLKLDPGTIKMGYINAFEVVSRPDINSAKTIPIASRSLDRLSKEDMGTSDKAFPEGLSELLSDEMYKRTDPINDRRFVFLGGFADKNTLPILTVDANHFPAFEKAVKQYGDVFNNILKQQPNYQPSTNPARALVENMSLILEEMWWNTNYAEDLAQGKSIAATMDTNKMQKRRVKWIHPHTVVQEDPEFVKQFVDAHPHQIGITYDPSTQKVMERMAIVRTDALDNLGQKVNRPIEVNGKQSNVDALLHNYFGTEIPDGATFYLIGQHDAIYHHVYGTLKDGTIKNVYSSQYGQPPMFIKHAEHGVTAEDPIGQWLIKNNLAKLSFTTAVKIGESSFGAYNLDEIANGQALQDKRTVNLPLSDFHRIKEEQNLDSRGSRPRQAINGSGVTPESPIFQSADKGNTLGPVLSRLMDAVLANLDDKFKDIDDTSSLKSLRDIVTNPISPKQVALSNILKDVFTKNTDAEILKNQPNILQLPMVAEHINRKAKNHLDEALQMIMPGWRGALGPADGDLQFHSQVEPIIHHQNMRYHITALPQNDEVFKAAIPEDDIRALVVKKRALQRNISIYNWQHQKALQEEAKTQLADVNTKLTETAEAYVAKEKDKGDERDQDLMDRMSAGVQQTHNFIKYDDTKVRNYIEDLTKKMIDPDTGRLNDKYILVTQDDASKQGIKPGDRVIATVTPSSSEKGIGVATVAAVLKTTGDNKVSDNNKIVLNSEWNQSKNGKDFDIDTVATTPYNPSYFSYEDWNKYLDILDKAGDAYDAKLLSTIKNVFARHNILPRDKAGNIVPLNEKTIYSDAVKVPYAQLLQGENHVTSKETFSPIGPDFHAINNAYRMDRSAPIRERLFHTAMSALDVRATGVEYPVFDSKGGILQHKTMNFAVNNPRWLETHFLHTFWTDHVMDLPNNTSLLKYNGDPQSPDTMTPMFGHMWGLSTAEARSLPPHYRDALTEFSKMLFNDAFTLAKIQDVQTNKSPELFDELFGINRQQRMLNALDNKDMALLAKTYEDLVDSQIDPNKTKPFIQQLAYQKKVFIRAFIDKLETKPSDNYPLFKLIKSLDITKTPLYGLSQRESLFAEAATAKDMITADPYLDEMSRKFIQAEAGTTKLSYFTRKKTENGKLVAYKPYRIDIKGVGDVNMYPDNVAINASLLAKEYDFWTHNKERTLLGTSGGVETRGGGPTEMAQKIAVAVIHGLDEVAHAKEGVSGDNLLNEMARKRSFPILFKEILAQSQLKAAGVVNHITIPYKKGSVTLALDAAGRLVIKSGDQAYYGSEVLAGVGKLQAALNVALTNRGEIWDSHENRLALNTLIRFPENLTIDQRKIALQTWIKDTLYGGKAPLSRRAQQVFWTSFMGQLTNMGLEDEKAYGLQINRALLAPNRPYHYGYNNTLLEMMGHFEKGMKDQFLDFYDKNVNKIQKSDAKTLSNNILNGNVKDKTVLYEPDFEERDPATAITEFLYDNMSQFHKEKDIFKKLAATYEDLRKQANHISTLQAIRESREDLKQIIIDVSQLTKAQFMKKYQTKGATFSQAFSNYSRGNADYIAIEYDLNPSVRTIKEISYVMAKMVKPYAREDRQPNLLNRFVSYHNLAQFRGSRVESTRLHADDTIVGTAMSIMGTIPEVVTEGLVKASLNRLPTNVTRAFGDYSIHQYQINSILRGTEARVIDGLSHIDTNDSINKALMSKDMKALRSLSNIRKDGEQLKQILTAFHKSKDWSYDLMSKVNHNTAIYNKAENMWDRDGIGVMRSANALDGTPTDKYIYGTKDGKRYDEAKGQSIFDLIKDVMPDASPLEKITFIQAIEVRKMLDIKGKEMLLTAINYLNALEQELTENNKVHGEEIEYISSLKGFYQDRLKAIATQQGNYVPREYPADLIKVYNDDRVYRATLETLKEEREKNQKLGRNGDPLKANATDQELKQKALQVVEQAWSEMAGARSNRTFAAPLKAGNIYRNLPVPYNTQPSVFRNYMKSLGKALGNDMAVATWYNTLNNMRIHGERPAIIREARRWTMNMASNPILQSTPIAKDKLKVGMTISAIKRSLTGDDISDNIYSSESRIYGTVLDINRKDNTIKLSIPVSKVLAKIKGDMKKISTEHDNIVLSGGTDANLSARQSIVLNELMKEGYTDIISKADQANLSRGDANDLIYKALAKAYKDPSKLGIHNLDDLYSKEYDGTINKQNIDRHSNPGVIEYMQDRATEAHDAIQIAGANATTMQEIDYWKWKILGNVGHGILTGYTRGLSDLVLGFLSSYKAKFKNTFGFAISNFAMQPLKTLSDLRRANATLGAVMHTSDFSSLDKEEKILNKVITAMGMKRSSEYIETIALGMANSMIEGTKGEGTPLDKLRYIREIFKSDPDFGKFTKRLDDLVKQQKESEPGDEIEIRKKIAQLILERRSIIQGIIDEELGRPMTKEEFDALGKKYQASIDKDGKKSTLAEQEGLTRRQAIWEAARVMGDWLYQGGTFGFQGLGKIVNNPFGIRMQAWVEQFRAQIFLIGFNKARDLGYSVEKSVLFGLNYVENWNGNYTAGAKQIGASTTIGRSLLQFAQYSLNGVKTMLELMREMMPQQIGKDIPEDENRFVTAFNRIFDESYESAKEQEKARRNPNYHPQDEINISRIWMMRMLQLAGIQMAYMLVWKGLQYPMDQMAQFVWGWMDTLLALGTNTQPADKTEEFQWLMDEINNATYNIGSGYRLLLNQLVNLLEGMPQGPVDVMNTGRIAQTFDIIDRFNTDWMIMTGHGDELSRQEQKHRMLNATYLIDSYLTGTQFIGTSVRNPEGGDLMYPNALFDMDKEKAFGGYDRPWEGGAKFMDLGGRIQDLIDHPFQDMFPGGDRIAHWAYDHGYTKSDPEN